MAAETAAAATPTTAAANKKTVVKGAVLSGILAIISK